MKTACWILGLGLILAPLGFARSDDKPPVENKLAALERLAGEWEIDAKWSDGSSLHGRSIYEWGLSKKILTAKSFVRGDKEYQRYESVFAWHPDKKSLYGITFAFDGAISEYLIESKDENTLHIGWTAVNPDKPPKVRQVLKFLDKDHFQWLVSVKDGDDWKQIMDGTWKRKAKP
jgi:hypothetical protein